MAITETAFLLIGALGLGVLHAFEVDHMTAVGVFVAGKPSRRQALSFGGKWALGHAISLLLFGSFLFALKLALSDSLVLGFERAIGLALLAVGLWTLFRLRSSEVVHVHRMGGSGPLWMGVLHGVAGTAAYVGQTVLIASGSFSFVIAYTLAFSAGVLAAMVVYAMVLSGVIRIGMRWNAGLATGARAVAGIWSCAIGLFWVFR